MPLNLETLFGLSSNLAMIGWLLLIATPRRWAWLTALTGTVIPVLLGLLYAGLMMTGFASVEGGGFSSMAEVKALFTSDTLILAGWVHYLAFDLAIGTVIARRADEAGISRLVQVPILLCTFMFGPVGFVLFVLTGLGWRFVGSAARAEVA